MLRNARPSRFIYYIQKYSFRQVFLLWLFIVLSFGITYYMLSAHTTFARLEGTNGFVNEGAPGLFNSIYFSFITTATVGYGDIHPVGLTKILAIIEVVIGIMMTGAVIAKLVSVKEEVILEEIYEITYEQKIDRLRSHLHTDRLNISNFFKKVESGLIREISIDGLKLLYFNLETHLRDIYYFLLKDGADKEYKLKLDRYNLLLIMTSIELCFERYHMMHDILCRQKLPYDASKLKRQLAEVHQITEDILKYVSRDHDEEINEKCASIRKYLAITCELGK